MSIISIILGVLLIVGGVCCMFTPFATFLSAGTMIAIMLFIYGIFGIVRFFQKEVGVLELIASILAIIVGVIAFIRPGGAQFFLKYLRGKGGGGGGRLSLSIHITP